MSKIMEKLLEEEKAAEKEMYGSEENPSPEAPSTEDDGYEDAPEEESVEESNQPEEKPKRTNWKKRFIGYKTATDETISKLREELYSNESKAKLLEQQVEQLTAQIKELRESAPPEDPFKDVFTEEDKNLLGEEALEAMKKAALATKREEKKETDPEVQQLKAELAEWKRREAEKAKRDAEEAYARSMDDLKVRLEKLVPDFESIDVDEAFGEYLQDIDDYSDHLRFDLFQKAVQNYDVAGVARFYQDFKAKSNKPKSSFLDDHITPEGDTATSDSPERNAKRRYHIDEYTSFMDDLTKGKYRGREKEAQKLEMMYDKAMVEGRIYE